MMLGALIDAGADVESIQKTLELLPVDGWSLTATPISRRGISATNLTVEADEGHTHRSAGDIAKIVDGSDVSPRVKEQSRAVFEALAEAEGAVHDKPPADVHFHEVGGLDAIVDVVGTCIALELLDVERIVVAPIAVGHGITKSAHGRIPHPAPATTRLLDGLPIRGIDTHVELTTPTGAAIARALADSHGPVPAMTIAASGFGAGDAELAEHPNLLQVILGEAAAPDLVSDPLIVVEANVDDLSGEYLAHGVQRLLDEGALDAWATPITMKRARPAVTISALVEPHDVDRLGRILLDESGSLGFRAYGTDRSSVAREVGDVVVDGQRIAIKFSGQTAKAEYRDVAVAASTLGRPAREVATQAEDLWRSRLGNDD